MTYLNEWDITAIVLYFVLVIAAGIYSMFRSARETVNGYFLAGRQMTWLPVGASLFASNIGSEHFIGLAGSGSAGGIGVAAFEINSAALVQLLGWVFLPVFISSKVSTLPEYMSKRFGGQRIRICLSILSLILYVFTKISVNLYSGALFIKLALGWDLYLSILLILALTAVCTITGGLAAVIYTDTLQAFVMIIGSFVLMIKAFIEVGGFQELLVKYVDAVPNITLPACSGQPRPDAWRLLRDPVNSDIPWPGFIFGKTFGTIWYWCADQMMVQRALAAKSLSHAQGGTLLTGYLKFLPLFLIVLPGMISRVLYTDIVACVDPDECQKYCNSRVSCSNLAYPLLILRLLPEGLRGILMAVMLAALMSDLTSVFNSASTLFAIDVWRRFRKKATTNELLLVGKIFVVVMVGISIGWIPIILKMQEGQLFLYIQAVSSYLSPPIACVYLFAILWKGFNEKGAFWGLLAGFSTGVVRLILDFTYTGPSCGVAGNQPPIIAKVHFMYFSLILCFITAIVGVTVSLFSEPTPQYRLIRTLFWTRFDETPREDEITNETCQNSFTSEVSKTPSGIGTMSLEVCDPGKAEDVKLPLWKKFAFWLCGCSSPGSDTTQQMTEEQKNVEQLSSLKQNPKAKLFLNINLVIILLVEIFMLSFFTVGIDWLAQSARNRTVNGTSFD